MPTALSSISRPLPLLMFMLLTAVAALAADGSAATERIVRATVGQRVQAPDGSITITCIGRKQNYDWRDTATLDKDILSPKSVTFHPDGTRYYVNSLEGGLTIVYEAWSGRKLKTIVHRHPSDGGPGWNVPSPYYRFTHYSDGSGRAFWGKPVESTFSHGGRYLWVPYYKRSFDINAQDPSAVAIIDTRCDSIVRMMETGPLPKMITCSHGGSLIAVTHWGNNTVGLIDISGNDPSRWHHLAPVAVGKELKLDFSLTEHIDRDTHSGLKLRGTAFTPDDRYLLVGCMGGGGIAVIDVQRREYLGIITGIYNARHLVTDHGYLYASCNVSGLVMRIPLDSIKAAIDRHSKGSIKPAGWETCQVDRGARTIELSPSGRFLFAVCNFSSSLNVVDTRTMQVVATIAVDSYPVGLDISHDGTLLVTTSQGHKGHGGNAVNLFSITYADVQAEALAATDTLATDTARALQDSPGGYGHTLLPPWRPWMNYACLIAALMAIIALAWWRSHK